MSENSTKITLTWPAFPKRSLKISGVTIQIVQVAVVENLEAAVVPYLLIETRTVWESEQVKAFLQLAKSLADQGQTVDLFLIQNAVLMAQVTGNQLVTALLQHAGVTVWVDDFSLESRELPAPLLEGVLVAGAHKLIELLTRPNCKPIWH